MNPFDVLVGFWVYRFLVLRACLLVRGQLNSNLLHN